PPRSYSLSLHDALPISSLTIHFTWRATKCCIGPMAANALLTNPSTHATTPVARLGSGAARLGRGLPSASYRTVNAAATLVASWRSEEHTSELQSQSNLV